MSANYIHISHLGIYISTQHTYHVCLMTHLALNGNFTTSVIHAITCCHVSEGIFFISDICNHQGTHIQKSAAYTDTTFNLIHYFNCTKIHHTKISAWRTWKKSIRTSCDGIKVKLCAPLGQWILYDHT